jgi:acyl-CoA synthetase (AMP-forming)/AMP-acid ligase II
MGVRAHGGILERSFRHHLHFRHHRPFQGVGHAPQLRPLYGRNLHVRRGLRPQRPALQRLPLFHGNAQFLSTMPALMSGASMVLAPRFSASRFWEDVKKNQCTEFNYIGGILQILYKAEPHSDDADNPLRVMFGAGAPPDLYGPLKSGSG